ncbi:MAG: hypothetical protein ABR922_20245 [Streptosporangiaceae bacterium]
MKIQIPAAQRSMDVFPSVFSAAGGTADAACCRQPASALGSG